MVWEKSTVVYIRSNYIIHITTISGPFVDMLEKKGRQTEEVTSKLAIGAMWIGPVADRLLVMAESRGENII